MSEHVSSLIHDASRRTRGDDAALLGALSHRCWPAGGDRHDPVASQWLRRWTPASMGAAAADCSCAAGRCGSCN